MAGAIRTSSRLLWCKVGEVGGSPDTGQFRLTAQEDVGVVHLDLGRYAARFPVLNSKTPARLLEIQNLRNFCRSTKVLN